MPHDVFISHSVTGKSTANAICNELESVGIRCWILPRDMAIGIPLDQSVAITIASCKIMVVVFTEYAALSDRVERQIGNAFNSGVVIIPFRTESSALVGSDSPANEPVHWLDALTPEMGARLRSLCDLVRGLLLRPGNAAPVLNTLMIGERVAARQSHSESVAGLHRYGPTDGEEQLSKPSIVPESSDSDWPANARPVVEQNPEGITGLSGRQPYRKSTSSAIKALLLILTPLLVVLGIGFWRTKTH